MAQCHPESSSLNSNEDYQLSAYDYELPEAYIAQNPVTPRDSAKLLVLDGPTTHHHGRFRDLVNWLKPGDLLIINNTRVIPARLFGRKQKKYKNGHQLADTTQMEGASPLTATPSTAKGAAVEVLLIEPLAADRWLALVKPGRRLQPGTQIVFSAPGGSVDTGSKNGPGSDDTPEIPLMTALVESRDEETNGRILKLTPYTANGLPERSINELIYELGQVPLPPYITRSEALPEQYQTVYAQRQGAIAAPTAGLHFTERLLRQLADKGVETAEVTLHVGIGTFRPVEVSAIETHQMHQERIDVPAETVEKIRQTKANGGRVIAVGTTSTRALEGATALSGELQSYQGKTDIFIYPGYQWQVIDGLITNFHLPGSSLLMMVSALMGRQRLMDIYQDAIAHQYRFYSFGDAMLILPDATVNA
ncbi:MAG: tRNA preQ1(34) S-adenosylmethionine ribosyltransferase-isomerase QueA [Cyanobacteria bacterium P01_F01_bin.53]